MPTITANSNTQRRRCDFKFPVCPHGQGERRPPGRRFGFPSANARGNPHPKGWAEGPRQPGGSLREGGARQRGAGATGGVGVTVSPPRGAGGEAPAEARNRAAERVGKRTREAGATAKGARRRRPARAAPFIRIPRPASPEKQKPAPRALRGGYAARFTTCAGRHGRPWRLTLSWLSVSWPRAGQPSSSLASKPWGKPSSIP